jgi:hypothetical protein
MAESFSILEDKKIDKFALDDACAEQASKFQKYARIAAKKKELKEEAKKELETLKARLYFKIKAGDYPLPIDTKTKKPVSVGTDTAIKMLIEIDEDVIVAKEKLIKAEGAYASADGNEKTMEHRRSSLNNLVSLFEKEYWDSKPYGMRPKHLKDEAKQGAIREALNSGKNEEEQED